VADSNQKTFLNIWKFESGIWILFFLLIAFWGVWRWYFSRVVNSTDGFYGIFALIAVVVISVWQKTPNRHINLILPLATFFTFLFAATYAYFPSLLQGAMAFTVLSCVISVWRFGKIFHFGVWSLFILSLPSIASLQFFFGYPMRVVIGEATEFLLKLNGLAVVRDGVGLNFGKQTIWIDAPCSGIKMLWTGFFLTALLVTLWRFSLAKSVLAFAIAFGIILIGNIFRATGLFYLEAEIVKMPGFAHDGIGVISFILTCIGIVLALQKLRPITKTIEEKSYSNKPAKVLQIIFILSCLAAIYVQTGTDKRVQPQVSKTVEFPATFEGKPLQELGLTEIEEYFMEDFPGTVKRFSDGEREIIIRYVREATRKLHSPADCFAGNGYQVAPLPLKIDENNNRWACLRATKGEQSLKVCERIYTDSGENWTDVSAWYWSALSDTNESGYWAIAVAENFSE
jgi:exosortase/archaeosortase family protein